MRHVRNGKQAESKQRRRPLERVQSGIHGLDLVTGGGLPRGRSILVVGGPGIGKSVLLNEYLYRGITELGENGVFVTIEEPPEKVNTNAATFGWNYDQLVSSGRLAFVDATPDALDQSSQAEMDQAYSLRPLVVRLRHAVETVKAKRVVIDSLGALFAQFRSQDAVRHALLYLVEEMQRLGVTSLLACQELLPHIRGDYGAIEEYVVDGVIKLTSQPGQQKTLRVLEVTKLRGCGYRTGPVEYVIHEDGFTIYPKIDVDFERSGSLPSQRLGTGVTDLDKLIGGGYPKGHIVLMSGNTGTGKSLFGMHFLAAAIERGETALFINLEESTTQILRMAKSHGWDFRRDLREERLYFLSPDLIDMTPDRLLFEIVHTVDRTGASVLVLDSVSAIPSSNYSEEQVRQFLLQLIRFLKARKVTCILSHMSSVIFGAGHDQRLGTFQSNDMRLASLADGFVLLRYGESDALVTKYINVLKMRGIKHDKGIHSYDIGKGRIDIQRNGRAKA